jgi:hypothetical protein
MKVEGVGFRVWDCHHCRYSLPHSHNSQLTSRTALEITLHRQAAPLLLNLTACMYVSDR